MTSQTLRGARLRVLTFVAICVTLVVAGVASAHIAGGGANIASAPTIALNQRIDGNLGAFQNNFGDRKGEYFKVPFQAGDYVTINVVSAGDMAPCPSVYLPGTDDYNFNYQSHQVPNRIGTSMGAISRTSS